MARTGLTNTLTRDGPAGNLTFGVGDAITINTLLRANENPKNVGLVIVYCDIARNQVRAGCPTQGKIRRMRGDDAPIAGVCTVTN